MTYTVEKPANSLIHTLSKHLLNAYRNWNPKYSYKKVFFSSKSVFNSRPTLNPKVMFKRGPLSV